MATNAFMLDSLSDSESATLAADAAESGAAFATEKPAKPKAPPSLPEPAAEPEYEADFEASEEGEAEPAAGVEALAKPKSESVPHAAFHSERTRRQAAETELRTLRERTDRLLEAMARPQAVPQAAPQPTPTLDLRPVPDINVDPAGHITATIHNQQVQLSVQNQMLRELAERENARINGATQSQQVQTVLNRAQALETEFKSITPDYEDAINFVATQRDKELQVLGVKDAVRRRQIMREEAQVVAFRAAQDNTNPAETVYEFAKARGYVSKGAAAPPAAERLATVAKTQAAQGPTLSQVSSTTKPKLTAKALAAMSPSEFDRIIQTPAGRRLLGEGA